MTHRCPDCNQKARVSFLSTSLCIIGGIAGGFGLYYGLDALGINLFERGGPRNRAPILYFLGGFGIAVFLSSYLIRMSKA